MIKGEIKRTIVYTGGGTAGHIFPGLAVAAEIRRETGESFRHCWFGSNRGMDRKLVEDAGIRFYGIPAGKLRRYLSVRNIVDIFRVAGGLVRSLVLLGKLKPAVVFSKGGYVTVPVVIAARILGIPSITHESDVEPGLATRINSRFSGRIIVSFEETLTYLSPAAREKAEVGGNPVRASLFSGNRARGLEMAGEGDKPVLLVLGGSQGARQINTLVAEGLAGLLGAFRIVHQHGSWDAPPKRQPGYLPFDFIGEELADFLAAAELVVCRAGASTLWELAALGKPSVLIPLGTGSSRGDQLSNAGVFGARGASVVLTGDVTAGDLTKEILDLISDPLRLETMSREAGRIAEKNAGEYISNIIQKEIKAYDGNSDN